MDLSDSGSSSDDDNLYTSAATALKALNSRGRRTIRDESSDESDDDFNPPSPKKKSPNTSKLDNNIGITNDSEEEEEKEEEQPKKRKTTRKSARVHDNLNTKENGSICKTSTRSTRNSNRINGEIPKQAAATSVEITDSVNISDDDEPKQQANISIADDSLNITLDDSYVLIGSPPASESEAKDDYEATIRIVWRSGDVVRFSLFMSETFQKIFKHFANLEKVPEDQVLITRKEKPIDPFDTPSSIKWSIVDMFEGGILSAELVKSHKNNNLAKKQGPMDDSIKIKIQTFDKKTLQMTLKPNEPFNSLIQKCSEELKITASKIKLYFDGEQIDTEETPKDLDIDDEACIDLKIAK